MLCMLFQAHQLNAVRARLCNAQNMYRKSLNILLPLTLVLCMAANAATLGKTGTKGNVSKLMVFNASLG